MTCITVYCVKCYCRIARPVLDTEQETLRESQQRRLEYSTEEQYQMNLRKSIKGTTAYLNLRELVEREFQNIFSEPKELVGEFREETDFENAIKQVEKEYADNIKSWRRQL